MYGWVCQQSTPDLKISPFACIAFEEVARRLPVFRGGVILYVCIECTDLLKGDCNIILASQCHKSVCILDLTLRRPILKSLFDVRSLCVAHGLELLVIKYFKVRAKKMCGETKIDFQILVTKYLFFISEDWIGELRVKC